MKGWVAMQTINMICDYVKSRGYAKQETGEFADAVSRAVCEMKKFLLSEYPSMDWLSDCEIESYILDMSYKDMEDQMRDIFDSLVKSALGTA